ncbi:MAG TPA: XamI family restriction endonuclease [Solirubrobacterales bacterium]|nr:XamI family restriction endonuclease [Solirubrobacterales bacterium]
MSPVAPPVWSDEQLELDRQAAIATFRRERLEEPLEQYLENFNDYKADVDELLEATVDLTQMWPPDESVLESKRLILALRYLAGPPISEDDLKVLAEEASLAPSKLKGDPEMAQRVVDTILIAIDRGRFPWVVEERDPEAAEREAATLASAALMATQRLATLRRSEGKTLQEDAVADALVEIEFKEVPPRTVSTISQAPGSGEFCRESEFGTRKADFLVGLWDGRTMAIECKVSNSATNSIKRLNNDTAVKATTWLKEFGTNQVVPAGVITGVFKLNKLKQAQGAGLSLFWAEQLGVMLDWIESTRP